jgi:hypothetical protein
METSSDTTNTVDYAHTNRFAVGDKVRFVTDCDHVTSGFQPGDVLTITNVAAEDTEWFGSYTATNDSGKVNMVWDEELASGGSRNPLIQSDLNEMIQTIAKEHLWIDTLQSQGRDGLDFHDVNVVAVKRALEHAFWLGFEVARAGVPS